MSRVRKSLTIILIFILICPPRVFSLAPSGFDQKTADDMTGDYHRREHVYAHMQKRVGTALTYEDFGALDQFDEAVAAYTYFGRRRLTPQDRSDAAEMVALLEAHGANHDLFRKAFDDFGLNNLLEISSDQFIKTGVFDALKMVLEEAASSDTPYSRAKITVGGKQYVLRLVPVESIPAHANARTIITEASWVPNEILIAFAPGQAQAVFHELIETVLFLAMQARPDDQMMAKYNVGYEFRLENYRQEGVLHTIAVLWERLLEKDKGGRPCTPDGALTSREKAQMEMESPDQLNRKIHGVITIADEIRRKSKWDDLAGSIEWGLNEKATELALRHALAVMDGALAQWEKKTALQKIAIKHPWDSFAKNIRNRLEASLKQYPHRLRAWFNAFSPFVQRDKKAFVQQNIAQLPTTGSSGKDFEREEEFYARRNEWVFPKEISYHHYDHGILPFKEAPRLYRKMKQIEKRLWKASGQKGLMPALMILQSQDPAIFHSDKTNCLYVSIGVMRMFQSVYDRVNEEDIAFVIATHIAWLGHEKEKGKIKKEEAGRRYMSIYQADSMGLDLANKAGYSVRNASNYVEGCVAFREARHMGRGAYFRKDIAAIKVLQDSVQNGLWPSDADWERYYLLVMESLHPESASLGKDDHEFVRAFTLTVTEDNFSETMRILTSKDRQILGKLLKWEADKLTGDLKYYEKPGKQYWSQDGPPVKDRVHKIQEHVGRRFMKHFNRPVNPLPKSVLSEIKKPTETERDYEAIASKRINLVQERIVEKLDSIEGILLLSRLEPALLTEGLYEWARAEITSKLNLRRRQKEALLYALNILFRKQDKNGELTAIADFNTFVGTVAFIPWLYMSGKAKEGKHKDEQEYDFWGAEREARFVSLYNASVNRDTEDLFFKQPALGKESFSNLLRCYRVWEKSSAPMAFRTHRSHALVPLAYEYLDQIRGTTAQKMRTLIQVGIAFKRSFKFELPVSYEQVAQDWMAGDPAFADVIRENPNMLQWFRLTHQLLRLKPRYRKEAIPGLGDNFRDAIKTFYELLVEDYGLIGELGLHARKLCCIWLPEIYQKYKPAVDDAGQYDHAFVSFLMEFFNKKRVRRLGPSYGYFTHFIYGLVHERLGKESVYKTAQADFGLPARPGKDYVRQREEIERSLCDLFHDEYVEVSTADGVRHRGVVDVGTSVTMSPWGAKLVIIKEDDGTGSDLTHEDVVGFQTRGGPTAKITGAGNAVFKNLMLEDLKQLYPQAASRLEMFSPALRSILFGMGKRIFLPSEELAARYLENVPVADAMALMDFIRDNIPSRLFKESGVGETKDEYLSSLLLYAICRQQSGKDWKKAKRDFDIFFANGKALDKALYPFWLKIGEDHILNPLPLQRRTMPRALKEPLLGETSLNVAVIQKLEAAVRDCFAAHRGARFTELGYLRKVAFVRRNIPGGPLRNWFLYYLFFEDVLRKELALTNEQFLNFEAIGRKLAQLPSQDKDGKFDRILQGYLLIASCMSADAVKGKNEELILNTMRRNRTGEELLPHEKEFYKEHQTKFGEFEFSEPGTNEAYVDLAMGNIFGAYLENQIGDKKMSMADKVRQIQSLFRRKSAARDRYLDRLMDVVRSDARLFQSCSLQGIKRVVSMAQGGPLKNKAKLLALEKETFVDDRPVSLEKELSMVKRYFPKSSRIRDDILLSVAKRSVQTQKQMQEVQRLLSEEEEQASTSEEGQEQLGEDLLGWFGEDMKIEEKEMTLLWIVGLSEEKPVKIKRMELVSYAKQDGLREKERLKTAHYEEIGRSDRRELLYGLLLKGNESSIRSGRAPAFAQNFLSHVFDKYNVDKTEPVNAKMLAMARILMERLREDPERQYAILSEAMLAVEELAKDARFKELSSSRKVAYLARIFLDSCGLLGIKLGQHMATSTTFDLSRAFKESFLLLTQKAKGMGLAPIFSILGEVGMGDVAIEGESNAASVKTVVKVKGTDELLKIMNLEVWYGAKKDVLLLGEVLAGFEEADVITHEQREELLEEAKLLVEEVIDFKKEKANARRLAQNYRRRNESGRGNAVVWIVTHMVPGRKNYELEFAQPKRVIEGVVMPEKVKPGISLKDYTGSDKESIQLFVGAEFLREAVVDGFCHADLHPGNIFIHPGGNKTTIGIIDAGETVTWDLRERELLQSVAMRMVGQNVLGRLTAFFPDRIGNVVFGRFARFVNVGDALGKLSRRKRKILDRVAYLFTSVEKEEAPRETAPRLSGGLEYIAQPDNVIAASL